MIKPPQKLEVSEGNVAVEEAPKIRHASARLKPPIVPRMVPQTAPEDEDDGFFARNKVLLIVGALVAGAGIWFGFFRQPGPAAPAAQKPSKIVMVMPVLPPPPPPPPKIKPPEPPKDNTKRPEQAPSEKPAEKPVEKPAEKPPEGLGTNVKGNGPGMAGLSNKGNGMFGGEGPGGGGGTSLGKWYAQQFQSKLVAALRNNPKTKNAVGSVPIDLVTDASGKMDFKLRGSTGNPQVDEALQQEIVALIRQLDADRKGRPLKVSLKVNMKRS